MFLTSRSVDILDVIYLVILSENFLKFIFEVQGDLFLSWKIFKQKYAHFSNTFQIN